MEERGLEPSAISGCSMGGIVGALVATGLRADEIQERFEGVPAIRILDKARFGGLLGHRGVDRVLAEHIPENFADLKFPLAVTAVDVQAGKLVILNRGKLLPALRATTALPGIFSPVYYESRVLVDGGLLNNLPVDVIGTMTLDPVVAVDVGAPPDRKLKFQDERSRLERLKEPNPTGQRPLAIELFMKTYDIPTALFSEMNLVVHRPEVLIRPPLDPNLKVEDFNRLDEAVAVGYKAACEVFDQENLV